MEPNAPQFYCKQFFKDDQPTPTTESFTNAMITLINRMEQNKKL